MKKKLFVSGKNLKKVTAALLAALLVLTMGFTSYAREGVNKASEGEKPGNPEESYVEQYYEDMARVGGYVDIPISKGSAAQKRMLRKSAPDSSYPEKYSSKEQDWAKAIKIKNQDKAGLCWAFTMTTCGEYSYAKEFGSTPEVSPGHLANFVHERVNDPLGNTGGDKNIMQMPDHWSLTGSNYFCVMFNAGTWSGYGLEVNTPYSVIDDNIQDEKWIGPSGSLYDAKYAYDDCMVVENLYYDGAAGQNLIKEWVTSYGAVGVSVPFYGEFMNYANYALYPTDYWGDNHAVTIIGWDDTYPAKNFAHKRNPDGSPLVVDGKELSDEAALEYTTPPGDGAWIVQNSWAENWGYDGCFYLSYYRAGSPFTSDAIAFDMMKADDYKYNFFYDGTAGTLDITDEIVAGFETVQGSKAANVFTNTTGEPITIDAVGYATFNTGICHYNVSIYTNLTDYADPESGILAGGGSFTGSLTGPRTAVLDTPARVEAGETYSVVFSFPEETAVLCMEATYNNGMYQYDAEIKEGQSFYKRADGQDWVDLAGKGACYRIKAFANPVKKDDGGNGGEGGDGDSEELPPPVDWEDPIYTAMAIAASGYPSEGIADIKGTFALSYGVMKYLEEHPNVTLRYKMTYKTNTYLVTIPGKDVVANPEIPWYGPEWLLTYFKWNPLPYEEFPS